MNNLEQKLDELCEWMELAKAEFNQATQCVVDALTGTHERLEYIEKWIESQQKS